MKLTLALKIAHQNLDGDRNYQHYPPASTQLLELHEMKIAKPTVTPNEELSEFERARRTSKTWSMGQD